jgi:hypothetical protein
VKREARQHLPAPGNVGSLAAIAQELDLLRDKTSRELRSKYEELYGVPTRSNNRKYLLDQIAWRMQEDAGLFDDVLRKVDELASLAPAVCHRRILREAGVPVVNTNEAAREGAKGTRDARLPPIGTVLEREYEGRTHRIKILAHGFESEGRRCRTLSEVARAITGTKWNGFLFFDEALTKARAAREGYR